MSSTSVIVLLICAFAFDNISAAATRFENVTTNIRTRTIGKHSDDNNEHNSGWSVIKEPISHLAGFIGNKFGHNDDHCDDVYTFPIDLPADAKIASYGKLQFSGFHYTYPGRLEYEKRALELHLKHDNHLTISGGGLKGVYSLRKIRFYSPSKHTVVGASYIGEIHFICDRIHHKHDDDDKKYDDTAIFVVFVMIGSEDNLAYDIIKKGMHHLTEHHSHYELKEGMSPGAFLPGDKCTFFRFHAKYSRHHCDVAVWTVFMEPIQISVHQYGHMEEHGEHDETEPERYSSQQSRTLEFDAFKSKSRRIITVQPRIFCKSPISYKDGFPWYFFHKSS